MTAGVVRPANVVRLRSLGSLVVMAMIVVVRAHVRMGRRVHVAIAHVDGGPAGAVLIVEVHAIVRHVLAVIVRGVRARQRTDAEVTAAAHDAFAARHLLVLADRAAIAGNLVPRCVGGRLGHMASPRSALHIESDGHRLVLRLAGFPLTADVLGYCLTRG